MGDVTYNIPSGIEKEMKRKFIAPSLEKKKKGFGLLSRFS
jgi:hypothetical protein